MEEDKGEEERGDHGKVTMLPAEEPSVLVVEIPFFFSHTSKQLKNRSWTLIPVSPLQPRIFWEILAQKPPLAPRVLP